MEKFYCLTLQAVFKTANSPAVRGTLNRSLVLKILLTTPAKMIGEKEKSKVKTTS